jgi:hypothetical protein
MVLRTFLTIASVIAFTVGTLALVAPSTLLETKGVTNATAEVWVREVGMLLLAAAFLAYRVRSHAYSPTLVAVLYANAIIQFGLLPIEIAAYQNGSIPSLSGIVPNSFIHLLLGLGFAYYALQSRPKSDAFQETRAK